MIDTPGKPSSPITFEIVDQVDKVDEVRLEFARLRQKQVGDYINFQLRKLELERQLAKAKIDAEIARLENIQNANGFEVDEDVRINSNLNARVDSLSLSEILYKLELPKKELPYFEGDSSTYHYFIRELKTHVESRVKENIQRFNIQCSMLFDRLRQAIDLLRACFTWTDRTRGNRGDTQKAKVDSKMFIFKIQTIWNCITIIGCRNYKEVG